MRVLDIGERVASVGDRDVTSGEELMLVKVTVLFGGW